MKTNRFVVAIAVFAVAVILSAASCSQGKSIPRTKILSKEVLMDKIKGGWAGQTIGCTYGGPTEFHYRGVRIDDSIPITYPDHCIAWFYDNAPGLYDDVYMDLTFVQVFQDKGLDAPVEEFAKAFSSKGYNLWHANQAARYNINHGIMPPQSGYWENNPHADDIDFQIEADYAGLMSPGMINTAASYSDGIGHMMNFGDGWYGGVYVAAMYSLAFVSDDINFIVEEALKEIPAQSRYYKCMSDVINSYRQYPQDWKKTWDMIQKNYGFDVGCPDGVYDKFDIDAVLNSAYILVGLLYGQGDWDKTLEFAARCGQDSDCNPASAGGILGCMLGYSHIPQKWMANLHEVEDRNFAYTDISLNKTYQMSYDQAMKVIALNGGVISDSDVKIKCQQPKAVRLEQSFAGITPKVKRTVDFDLARTTASNGPSETDTLMFSGTGIVAGYKMTLAKDAPADYAADIEVYMDGQLLETAELPAEFVKNKQQLFWKYDLDNKVHTLSFRWTNPQKGVTCHVSYLLEYVPEGK